MLPIYSGKLIKGRKRVSVCVHVIRKWTFNEDMGNGAPLYVGLILADTWGDVTYANVPQEQIKAKESLVVVSRTYTISKFKVTKAKSSYQPFDAELMIEFTDYTDGTLVKNPADTFSEYTSTQVCLNQVTRSQLHETSLGAARSQQDQSQILSVE